MIGGPKLFLVLLLGQVSLFSQVTGEAELIREQKNAKTIARIDLLNELAKYHHTSKLEQAEAYAAQALDLAMKLEYPKGMFYSNLYLALTSRKSVNLEQDMIHLQVSLAIAQRENNTTWLLEAYNSLNNNVIQREDYQQAGIELNRALMDYIRLNDTIFNRVESNQIRELGGKYESTLKEEII